MQYGWFETPRRLMEIEPLCTWLNNNHVSKSGSEYTWSCVDFRIVIQAKKFGPGIWVLWENKLNFLTEKEHAEDIKYYKGFLPQLDFTSLVFNSITWRGWYYTSHSHPLCTEVIYG